MREATKENNDKFRAALENCEYSLEKIGNAYAVYDEVLNTPWITRDTQELALFSNAIDIAKILVKNGNGNVKNEHFSFLEDVACGDELVDLDGVYSDKPKTKTKTTTKCKA